MTRLVWLAAAPVAALLLFALLAAQPAPGDSCSGFPPAARMVVYDQALTDLAEGRENAPRRDYNCECMAAVAADYPGWAAVRYYCPAANAVFSGLFENGSESALAQSVTFLSNGSRIEGPLVGDPRTRPCEGLPRNAVLYLVAGDLRRFGEGAAPAESLTGYVGTCVGETQSGNLRVAHYFWPLQNRTLFVPFRQGEMWPGEVVEFIANETDYVGPVRLMDKPGAGGV